MDEEVDAVCGLSVGTQKKIVIGKSLVQVVWLGPVVGTEEEER